MKYLTTWNVVPGATKEVAEKFLAGEAVPQEGVKLLGRWHRVDCGGGFSLYETDSPEQFYRGTAKWADLLEFEIYPVVEDAQVGPVLSELYGK